MSTFSIKVITMMRHRATNNFNRIIDESLSFYIQLTKN